MFKKFFILNLFLLFFSSFGFTEEVKDVKIEGNKRLSRESIIVLGEININSDFDNNTLNLILKNLYSTNFFKEVDLNIQKK